jgi:DNA polymerase I
LPLQGLFFIFIFMRKDFQDLLNNISKEDTPQSQESKNDRILVIDALNLFFRNFATINMVNQDGAHIGGLGGFLRSLGSLIRTIQPTGVYVIFDGIGSSTNRKNLMPEYKSNRGLTRITNWDTFDDLEDEDDAKVSQITRVIQYLKCLPIKMGMIDKAEADDMIAYLSKRLPEEYGSSVIIVSSDKDYIQLVNPKVTLYRPVNKVFFDADKVKEEFGIPVENFIIYKTLLGDQSDQVAGIKGLGPKTLLKRFPELTSQKVTMEDIFKWSEERLTENKIYPRILQKEMDLRNNYRLMDLANPILDDRQIAYIEGIISSDYNGFSPKNFLSLYEIDGLGHIIRNVEWWLKDVFEKLNSYK